MQGSEDGLTLVQALVVQRVDSTNHWMNHSPMGNSIGFGSISAMDPTFKNWGQMSRNIIYDPAHSPLLSKGRRKMIAAESIDVFSHLQFHA